MTGEDLPVDVVEALTPPPSPARTREAERGTLVIGTVQARWYADPEEHAAGLDEAIGAAHRGAQVVFCPELTLSRYPADAHPTGRPLDAAEPLVGDPYGRVLARAPRDSDAVLVTTPDLDARRDWLELFPLLSTRRPETYAVLVRPVASE